MSGPDITLGFIPLTDAVLPILMAQMCFAAEDGLSLALVRETSWVAMEAYPAAYMLSPLARALTAGALVGQPDAGPRACLVRMFRRRAQHYHGGHRVWCCER